jgi:hypothetical protein
VDADTILGDSSSAVSIEGCRSDAIATGLTRAGNLAALERAVNYVLDDCFFAVGQAVGTRKTLEFEAVVWWRDHYRVKFLGAMRTFGDRWLDDRHNVTGVAFMLAERAVRYAGDAASIDETAARKAAVDVERYCELHSRRAAHARGLVSADGAVPLVAGYWCTEFPEPDPPPTDRPRKAARRM